MKFTRTTMVRLRDIFDEQMFSASNYIRSDGRSRITFWLDRLGVRRIHKNHPMPLVEDGCVVVDCTDLKNQLLTYHLMVPVELAEKILVLGVMPSEEESEG